MKTEDTLYFNCSGNKHCMSTKLSAGMLQVPVGTICTKKGVADTDKPPVLPRQFSVAIETTEQTGDQPSRKTGNRLYMDADSAIYRIDRVTPAGMPLADVIDDRAGKN